MKIMTLSFNDFTTGMQPQRTNPVSSFMRNFRFRQFDKKFNNNIFFFALIAVIVLGGVFFMFSKLTSGGPQTVAGATDQRLDAPMAKRVQEINKTFSFPIKDAKGAVVTSLRYKIQKAELFDEIIIRGQRAYAVKGKSFMILSIEITNDYKQSIDLNSIDYVRLSLNNSEKRYSPSINNDPVHVDAISTKNTRVGFQVNDSDRDVTIYIGEIEGTKEKIAINLQ